MSMSSAERNTLWERFLQRWPLKKLSQITLQEYTEAGNPDCFTFGWLEKSTENLGSIWGGSAFKFGIYSRKDQSIKSNGGGKSYTSGYGWYGKYGTSPEEAFKRVRSIIVEIAMASQVGDLALIEKADLGNAIKWKLAFLYQNRLDPKVLPVYSAEFLKAYLQQTSKTSLSEMHTAIMARRGGTDVLEFGQRVWEQAEISLSALILKPEEALAFFQDNPDRFQPIKSPTVYLAGFTTIDGRSLAVSLKQKEAKLWIEPGKWLDEVKAKLKDIESYTPERTRSSNLAANAPALDKGNPALFLTVPTLAALVDLCDAYDNSNLPENNIMSIEASPTIKHYLNQILYGPPGTGKTYSTIDAALEIIDPKFLLAHPENLDADWVTQQERRTILKQRFDELSTSGRIRFVTFHQSFSYEDFVEGIRALPSEENSLSSGSIQYQVEKGIFCQLCEDAQRNKVYEEQIGVRDNANVWKISIEEANSSGDTRRYCFENAEARIGWPIAKDIKLTNLADPDLKLGSNEQSSLANFGRDIVPGDVLLCLGTISEICAVGVVTGEYEYNEHVPTGVRPDYVHKLPVKWLATDLKFNIKDLNQGVGLTLKAVYLLKRIKWPVLQEALLRANIVSIEVSSSTSLSTEPHVLIIDEINRGNVSRIFGELITLIEPSKRSNADEALATILPYSKERFSVPGNVYLIGTMNTADRSLAGLDIALRRRFSFKEMPPRPELLKDISIDNVSIAQVLRTLNERIEVLLDRDHCLGHAYFISLKSNSHLEELAFIFRQKILPLLQEYFFEDWERISWVLNDHNKSPECQFLKRTSSNLGSLFGGDVAVNLQDRRWNINEDAFNQIESYSGIIGSHT